MKEIQNHIILCLIALVGTNMYFVLWLLIDSQVLHTQLVAHLSFMEFVGITNGALLIISIFSATYKKLGDKVLAWGYSNFFRFVLLIVLSVIVFVAAYTILIVLHFQLKPVDEPLNAVINSIDNTYFLPLVFFFGLISILMFFISNLERRSGSVVRLLSQSMGHSIKPHLVERGFMFIDLNDATCLAERLSSQKYANLLRDCFRMLNELVDVSPFEIYQYVGDEAVITWDAGIKKADIFALQLFSDFKAYLEENSSAFALCPEPVEGKAYDLQPKFKCAIHSGRVVQSEIGKEVKHLVYHGDVLNTTSRLLSYCHILKTDCIISEDAVQHPEILKEKFHLEATTADNLKGKVNTVVAYKVTEKRQCEAPRVPLYTNSIFLPLKVTNSQQLNIYETKF